MSGVGNEGEGPAVEDPPAQEAEQPAEEDVEEDDGGAREAGTQTTGTQTGTPIGTTFRLLENLARDARREQGGSSFQSVNPLEAAKIMNILPALQTKDSVDNWAIKVAAIMNGLRLPRECWPRLVLSKLPAGLMQTLQHTHEDLVNGGECTTTFDELCATLRRGSASAISQKDMRSALRALTPKVGHMQVFASEFRRLASMWRDPRFKLGGVDGCDIIIRQIGLQQRYENMYRMVIQHKTDGEWTDWDELLNFIVERDQDASKMAAPARPKSSYAAAAAAAPKRGRFEQRDGRERKEKQPRRDAGSAPAAGERPWYQGGPMTDKIRDFIDKNNGCRYCREINLPGGPESHRPCPNKKQPARK